MSRLCIIDGDVLAYRSFEPRWEYNVDAHGQRVFDIDPETGKATPRVKTYTQEENAEYLMQTWQRFERKLPDLVDACFCDEYVMAVQGPGNFRAKMYPMYKQQKSRAYKPSEMSQLVPTIRQLAVKGGLAIPSVGCEADDLIRIWANEARACGQEYVVASIDKDLLCIPGKHYNIKKEEFTDVDEAAALRLYYEQLIQGDQIDNIPGIVGIGPVKAQKALAACTTVEEYQYAVVDMYIRHYQDQWHNQLLANGKLIHIMRHENDWFDLEDWPIAQEILACST